MSDRVAHLSLNRPDRHNAFNRDVIDRLSHLFNDFARRDDIVAVVLEGKGKSFSAGADLNWMEEAAQASYEENEADAWALADMLYDLYTLPQATIGSVHGAAMGGGLGLAACCDIVVCRENTTFALSEVRLGLIPATISPYVIRAIGARQARRFFQTGERFSGEKAGEIGLAHEVVENAEEQEETVKDLLDEIKNNGPEAMKKAKRLTRKFGYGQITDEEIRETSRLIADTRSSAEGREGVRAFLEDRDPNWEHPESNE